MEKAIEKLKALVELTDEYPKEHAVYMYVLGLADEMLEMLTAETLGAMGKEFGDVLWYYTAFAIANGDSELFDLEPYGTTTKTFSYPIDNALMQHCSKLISLVKKHYRGDEGLQTDGEFCTRASIHVSAIHAYLKSYAFAIPDTVDMLAEKLLKRKKEGTIKGSGDDR